MPELTQQQISDQLWAPDAAGGTTAAPVALGEGNRQTAEGQQVATEAPSGTVHVVTVTDPDELMEGSAVQGSSRETVVSLGNLDEGINFEEPAATTAATTAVTTQTQEQQQATTPAVPELLQGLPADQQGFVTSAIFLAKTINIPISEAFARVSGQSPAVAAQTTQAATTQTQTQASAEPQALQDLRAQYTEVRAKLKEAASKDYYDDEADNLNDQARELIAKITKAEIKLEMQQAQQEQTEAQKADDVWFEAFEKELAPLADSYPDLEKADSLLSKTAALIRTAVTARDPEYKHIWSQFEGKSAIGAEVAKEAIKLTGAKPIVPAGQQQQRQQGVVLTPAGGRSTPSQGASTAEQTAAALAGSMSKLNDSQMGDYLTNSLYGARQDDGTVLSTVTR